MREHIFFDSLNEWVSAAQKDKSVYTLPFNENHPSTTQGVRLYFYLIQLSQVASEEAVHHCRFLTGQRVDPNLPEERQKESKKQERIFQTLLTWLQKQGFSDVKQGFFSFDKNLRTVDTYLPKNFYEEE